LRLERICLRSLVGNKFGYNVIAACVTTPTLYCSAIRKPNTWTQKAPMHRRTVNRAAVFSTDCRLDSVELRPADCYGSQIWRWWNCWLLCESKFEV